MYLNEEIQNKWAPVLDKWAPVLEHADLAPIKDTHRRSVTATLLENTEKALRENGGYAPTSLLETPTNATGAAIDTYDPVLISLVRRAMPNMIAYDICGVQPMTGPTGLIFAMRSRYTDQANTEAFYNEANTSFSARNQGNTTQLTLLMPLALSILVQFLAFLTMPKLVFTTSKVVLTLPFLKHVVRLPTLSLLKWHSRLRKLL